MLNEIINSIGKEEIIDKQPESISNNNCIYIKIPIDKNINYNMEYVDKEITVANLSFINWCKKREVYSLNINSNKNIMQRGNFSKTVLSCVPYSVIFKYNTFTKKEYTKKHSIIDSFYIMIKEYLTILNFEQYISFYSNIFNTISDDIIQLIEQQNQAKRENLKIKMFLDLPIEKYKEEYEKYLNLKIFTETVLKIEGEQKGRGSFFYNLNPNKPLLSYGKTTKEIHLLSLNEAKFQLQLNRYLNWKNEQTIQNGLQTIKYKTSNNNGLCVIEDFDINPIQEKENSIYFNIFNIMNIKNFEEKTIDSNKELFKYLIRITNKEYIKNDKDDLFVEQNKLEKLLNDYKKIFYIKVSNINDFKISYKCFIKTLFDIYYKKDSRYKIAALMNFDICISDWLFHTNRREKIMKLMNQIKNKIISNTIYEIEDEEEFFILCGQLAQYFKLKRQGIEKTNRLFKDYLYAKDTNSIINLLKMDKKKLDYDTFIGKSRSNIIMSAIEMYFVKNGKNNIKLDDDCFNIGLYYGENLIFSKKEIKSNADGK